MSGRREQRAELEATWQVWDALRPIRRADMIPDSAEPPQPEPAQPAAEPCPSPDGGTT